ncbi:MAG: hypothetical protein E7411_09025 [Ruminococcaceae bacterium]|nr:hypothetical protein [Oscillospiraceae bacterium]
MKENNNRKKMFVCALISIAVLCLSSCCNHTWEEATCETPKTCSECGKTEGDVVHKWNEATCTEKRTCNKCGITSEPVGHIWQEATCVLPRTCNACEETEGVALGHTTRLGECSRCGEDIDDIELKDGFAVVTYKDTTWMQEKDDFVDVYIFGTIQEISKVNEIRITDTDNGEWTIDVGTACDLSNYIGTACEIYGFSSGGISSQYKTPLVNMDHDNNRIVFADGKELYPKSFESTQQFEDKYKETAADKSIGTVWIPTDGGKKYHSRSNCSGMDNPTQIDAEDAIQQGYSKCGKCW